MSEEFIFGNIGVTNTSIGTNTLASVTTGIDNTAFGTDALRYVTDGDGNSGFGINVISDVSGNPSLCTGFGTDVLQSITSGTGNTGFGYQVLTNLTTGVNNSVFGSAAGVTLINGENNVLFGANVDTDYGGASNAVAIGSGDLGMSENVITTDNEVTIGFNVKSNGSSNVKLGSQTNGDLFPFWVTAIGKDAGSQDPNPGRFGMIYIGHECETDLNSDYFPYSDEGVAIGKWCRRYCSNAFGDTVIGYEARQTGGFGSALSTVVGTRANQVPFTTVADASVITIFGYEAGLNAIDDQDNSITGFERYKRVFVGAFSGQAVVQEGNDHAVGYEAMKNTRGGQNFAMGYRALMGSTTYGPPDASAGTAVGAGKLASVATTVPGTAFIREIVDYDVTGATTAGLDGTYFLISSGIEDYYVWFNIDGGSVDPAVPNREPIEISLTSGATEITIGNAIRSAVGFANPNGDFHVWIPNQNNIIRVQPTVNGDTTDISAGTAVGDLQLVSVTKLADGTAGTPEMSEIDVGDNPLAEALSQNYFLISSPTTDYYVWFNNDGNDTDPGPGGLNLPALVGKTGIQVIVDPDDYISGFDFGYLVGQNIRNALNGSGAFTAVNAPNIYRVKINNKSENNVAMGNNAFDNATVGSGNVVVGSNAAPTLEGGRNNILVGSAVDSSIKTINATLLGRGSTVSGDGAIVLGAGSSATADGAMAIGAGVTAATADGVQIGPNAVSGAATMNFGSQIVSDEAWVGGGTTTMSIDNSGNIVRSTPLVF
jgi:hypothetical protein